ncbi:hypothetical protein ELQ32_07930 [Limnobaculum zhutongyuii]|nr:hypothetical protein [Limnobaculum zhutongyuii]TQS89104.1 hypothetical protein ELQ32_07930 [Limnobaculum zhutongyuii]
MSDLTSEHSLTASHPTLADAICAKVGKRDIALWATALERHFTLSPFSLLPEKLEKEHHVEISVAGLILVFSHPHAVYSDTGDVARWFLKSVEFSFMSSDHTCWKASAPFGLTPKEETHQSIESKLGDDATDIRKEDLRQSFYLDDGLVACVMWHPSGKGIQSLTVVRLGSEMDYEPLNVELSLR